MTFAMGFREDTKKCTRHVPHNERSPQTVSKRNARERRRVQAVNSAFMRLKKVVPFENTRGKRISKVKTLLKAIEYIRGLIHLLQNQRDCSYPDFSMGGYFVHHMESSVYDEWEYEKNEFAYYQDRKHQF
ncbi:achaete-scute complex protein T4-like [Cylas formicarius]|uniref:achaete-scute complex protein T4-like n=1 Tax=Cylas formicarius TaxID=197179 RepID=UPI0029588959|nr:achaete-scute complex protein T4-like [Cylas formicarius]